TWASGLRPTMDSSPLILNVRPTVPGVDAAVTTSQAATGCGWVVGMGWRVVVSSLTDAASLARSRSVTSRAVMGQDPPSHPLSASFAQPSLGGEGSRAQRGSL